MMSTRAQLPEKFSDPVCPPSRPRRNRVTPLGDIVAIPLRGRWLGNRGILHDGLNIVRFHRSQLWITCTLRHKDWRLPQWEPHHFTVLFFHDEAVSLAAGHRPCALCRRADYNDYRRAWAAGHKRPLPLAKDMDRQLHGERVVRGTHRRQLHSVRWSLVPVGAFVLLDDGPALIGTDLLMVPWTPEGYGRARKRPERGTAQVITPPSSLLALRHGYRPQVSWGGTDIWRRD